MIRRLLRWLLGSPPQSNGCPTCEHHLTLHDSRGCHAIEYVRAGEQDGPLVREERCTCPVQVSHGVQFVPAVHS